MIYLLGHEHPGQIKRRLIGHELTKTTGSKDHLTYIYLNDSFELAQDIGDVVSDLVGGHVTKVTVSEIILTDVERIQCSGKVVFLGHQPTENSSCMLRPSNSK